MSYTLNEYKGYLGSIEHDLEDGILYGKILFINDLVNYEGSTLPELQSSFESAVDEYLALCEEIHAEPNKPMNGTFNVRIGAENHRRLAMAAAKRGEKINTLVKEAVELLLAGSQPRHVTHTHEHVVKIEAISVVEGSFGAQNIKWPIENQKSKNHYPQLN